MNLQPDGGELINTMEKIECIRQQIVDITTIINEKKEAIETDKEKLIQMKNFENPIKDVIWVKNRMNKVYKKCYFDIVDEMCRQHDDWERKVDKGYRSLIFFERKANIRMDCASRKKIKRKGDIKTSKRREEIRKFEERKENLLLMEKTIKFKTVYLDKIKQIAETYGIKKPD